MAVAFLIIVLKIDGVLFPFGGACYSARPHVVKGDQAIGTVYTHPQAGVTPCYVFRFEPAGELHSFSAEYRIDQQATGSESSFLRLFNRKGVAAVLLIDGIELYGVAAILLPC